METYYIYKICCDDVPEFYIGSTQSVRHRKGSHKKRCNGKSDNYKIYQTIRANGGWNNWRMVVIEEMPNTTKIGAKIQEEFHRVELKATLNMRSAYSGLTKEEYQKKYKATHNEEIKEQQREYNQTHKEEIKEYKKEYYQSHSEEIKEYKKEYRATHSEEIKEYNATHREELNEYQKEYRAIHKEEINRKRRESRARKKAEKSTQSLDVLV
tara:strand:+ start:201 stop:833 length:633 start_codon:yes stop_codon:yes gene_type:complete